MASIEKEAIENVGVALTKPLSGEKGVEISRWKAALTVDAVGVSGSSKLKGVIPHCSDDNNSGWMKETLRLILDWVERQTPIAT